MLLEDFSTETFKVYSSENHGPYWLHYKGPLSGDRSVTLGSYTAYGFVENPDATAQNLLTAADVKNELRRFLDFEAMDLPKLKRGSDREVLRKTSYPEKYRDMYKAMEAAFDAKNPGVRVSMREGKVVFAKALPISAGKDSKHLAWDNEDTAKRQLEFAGVPYPAPKARKRTPKLKPARLPTFRVCTAW